MKPRLGRGSLVVVLALATVACGRPAVRAAESGDLARLRAEIAAKHERGGLSNAGAAELARAVAARELLTAKDERAAVLRVGETRACAVELDDALAERMDRHDAAGAAAALERLENGALGQGAARRYLADPDALWRAVGARALSDEDDGDLRRAALLDASPRVRRSAIAAAQEARDPRDLDVLFETARVDPEPLLRNLAIRAMSAIVRGDDEGRARAAELATRLRDLWTAGDDAVREDVAVAWALSPVFESGGREALRVTLASGEGPGALTAAGVVENAPVHDAELEASASALLSRTIREGSRRERLQAIAVAATRGAELDAMRAAAKEEDLDVRIPALGRLLGSAPDRPAAVRELERLAGYGTKGAPPAPADVVRHAADARLALAYAGDLRVQAWIEEDLAAELPSRRLGAASALAALGRAARAAPLLADPDPSVRTRAACTLLVAARR